ncbi:MAG TPA: N-acetylmuramidase domain-containing protein [Gemmatimonadales bacterium]|nr:N-acetylmuramidase domain-containing protein [Gemmatimonadales bacterium]
MSQRHTRARSIGQMDITPFLGSGRPLSDQGMDLVCDSLSVTESEIWAVLSVETRAFGFLPDRRPLILFERHVFHRLTQGRHSAVHPEISNATPGGYLGGAAEYKRLARPSRSTARRRSRARHGASAR